MVVFFIDDSAMIQALYRLSSKIFLPEAEVVIASGCEEALEAMDHIFPDVMITDWSMTDGGGCRMVKKALKRNLPLEKIIIVSGRQPDEISREINGKIRIFQKPVDLPILFEAIKTALAITV